MSTKNSTKFDRQARELAKAWNLKLTASRTILQSQIDGGSPSICDVMDLVELHANKNRRELPAFTFGVTWRGDWDQSVTIEGLDGRPDLSVEGAPLCGKPFFAPSHVTAISGGASSGKTTLIHNLLEQAAALTSPFDTQIIVLGDPDGHLGSRIAHLGERVVFISAKELDEESNAIYRAMPTVSQAIIFADDLDITLAGSASAWEQMTRSIDGSQLFFTVRNATPRHVPRQLIHGGGNVLINLVGGSLPEAGAPTWEWTAYVYAPKESHFNRKAVRCFGDLPEGVYPINAEALFTAGVGAYFERGETAYSFKQKPTPSEVAEVVAEREAGGESPLKAVTWPGRFISPPN